MFRCCDKFLCDGISLCVLSLHRKTSQASIYVPLSQTGNAREENDQTEQIFTMALNSI